MTGRVSWRAESNHRPCPGGCNELADECACTQPDPFGSMRVTPPRGSVRLMELPKGDDDA